MDSQTDRVVAITGAGGALGRRVRELCTADPAVGEVRSLEERDDEGFELAGVGTVVHLAFDANTEIDPEGSARRNVGRARRLLDAAGRARTPHVIVLSSATVYGAWPQNPIPLTEEAPLRPNRELAYASQHGAIEALVADWAADHPDTVIAVLRPVIALAEDDNGWMARSLAAAAGLRAGEDDPPVQFIHLDDLAAAVDVVRRQRATGAFNVAPDGWIPGDAVRALAGDKPRLELPARVAARLATWSWELRLGPIPPGLVPYTEHPWVVANDRLRQLGWTPEHTNEEAFVSGTKGTWWSMMSPKRKQELALGVPGVALLIGAVAIAWLVRRARRATRA